MDAVKRCTFRLAVQLDPKANTLLDLEASKRCAQGPFNCRRTRHGGCEENEIQWSKPKWLCFQWFLWNAIIL